MWDISLIKVETGSIISSYDGLKLSTAITQPKGSIQAVVVLSHGMAEHKERYYPFMKELSEYGYYCAILDHRGHGASVKSTKDHGYFYTEDESAIVEDLHTLVKDLKSHFPTLPFYLFSHSMGTLVARCYMKKYDGEINKLVLCGPPTQNPAVNAGLSLAKVLKPLIPEKKPNKILDNIAFAGYNKGNDTPFGWLSVNKENVQAYIKDPLCGFVFTTNGFVNLFKLQKGAFESSDWKVTNPELPILVIAGKEDPVIQSTEKFMELLAFLKKLGYTKVEHKLYAGMRHEILNETDNITVYDDIVKFFKRGEKKIMTWKEQYAKKIQ